MTDTLAHEAANDLRRQLGLNYTPIFSWPKAIQIIWSLLTFLGAVGFLVRANGNLNIEVAGAFFAILFLMTIHGTPFAMKLDKVSQVRFEKWLESQRESE